MAPTIECEGRPDSNISISIDIVRAVHTNTRHLAQPRVSLTLVLVRHRPALQVLTNLLKTAAISTVTDYKSTRLRHL